MPIYKLYAERFNHETGEHDPDPIFTVNNGTEILRFWEENDDKAIAYRDKLCGVRTDVCCSDLYRMSENEYIYLPVSVATQQGIHPETTNPPLADTFAPFEDGDYECQCEEWSMPYKDFDINYTDENARHYHSSNYCQIITTWEREQDEDL